MTRSKMTIDAALLSCSAAQIDAANLQLIKNFPKSIMSEKAVCLQCS